LATGTKTNSQNAAAPAPAATAANAAAPAKTHSAPKGKAENSAIHGEAAKVMQARIKGYEGDACPVCGSFTLLRSGTCMKCDTCGGTTGCS